MNFFTFCTFLDAKNTKYSVKSSKLVGNRQTIHIRVEELKEIFFHTLSAIITSKTVEISILEKVDQKGGVKMAQKIVKNRYDLSNLCHIPGRSTLYPSTKILTLQ